MKQLCLLIGEDNLVIECANILLQRDFEIAAIISAIKPIKTWAQKKNILCVCSISEYVKAKNKSVDYLFSIVNSSILNAEHLKIVKKLALNYHDSLLPAYRGLNATTWAILNNEKEHGISWHRIEPDIDAGDIAYQKRFSIDKETVLSLNLRCFEEAVLGFTNIIDAIEAENLNLYKQSSANKSYYGRGHLLPGLGFINWKVDTGEYIDGYFRALANGHYNNYVGTIKLFYKNTFVIISSIRLGNSDITNARPGEVIKITEDGIEIATTSTPVIIEQCTTLSGKKLNALDVVKKLSLIEGKQLKTLCIDKLNELSTHYKKALLRENFWVKEFAKVIDHNVYSQITHAKSAKMSNIGSFVLEPSQDSSNKYAISTWFVTIIIIYLFRINNYENSSCFLTNMQEKMLDGIGSRLFGNYFPITCYLDAKNTVGDVLKIVDEKLNDLLKETTYLSDIFLRYPELENTSLDSAITISIGSNRKLNSSKSILHFELDVNTVKVFHNVELDYQDGELRSLLSNITSHLKAIVESVVKNPQKCIKDVSLISETELRQIYLWGKGDVRPIPNCTISALIKENVISRPDSVAICEEGSHVTYHDLWHQSEKIAIYIKALRTHVQTPIGIYMPRSKEMIFTLLGILRAGCIYVPLEFKYPLNKINLIINEAEIEHVFCVNSGVERFKTFYGSDKKINTISVSDILEREVVGETYKDEKSQISTQSIAYIMFTSGTTGLPKGVLISHQNVINYCMWFQKSASFTNESVMDFSSSLAFDLSIPCTLAPLIAGGTIAVCSEKNKVNAKLYLEHLNINEITHVELTPGYLEILLTYPEKIQALHYLKYLFLGADVVHTEEVKQWLELSYGCQVINEYGPTEATVSVTSYFVKNIDSLTGNVVPIGRPGYNSTCYVVDKFMNICPVGMIGELCIGGKQVSKGYLKRPQLTEEKFVEVAFDGDDILYKTGDLVCWLPMGDLQFFGRNDHQVKIHGYRIELPAIESVLMKHDLISQAVVIIRKAKKEKILRAYLVTDDINISSKEILSFLSAHLPVYMHPKELCIVDGIPLKENEKINFDLLEKYPGTLLSDTPPKAPHILTTMEDICCRCFKEAFHREDLDVDDNFFSLDGDSLTALHIISKLKDIVYQDIHLSVLFEYPTIRKLAEYLEEVLVNIDRNVLNKTKNCLIQMSSGTLKPPLFLVHPVGGTTFWYKSLAKEFDGILNLYGIEDPSIHDANFKFSTLEAMAKFYVEQILNLYDEKTYYIGGASFGATVAVAMADILLQMGKEVGFLGLFDGWVKYPETLMQQNIITTDIYKNVPQLSIESYQTLQSLENYRRDLLLNYEIPIINTGAILFKADELWSEFTDINTKDNGWIKYANARLTIYTVPGNHETMFSSTHVQSLAGLILKSI